MRISLKSQLCITLMLCVLGLTIVTAEAACNSEAWNIVGNVRQFTSIASYDISTVAYNVNGQDHIFIAFDYSCLPYVMEYTVGSNKWKNLPAPTTSPKAINTRLALDKTNQILYLMYKHPNDPNATIKKYDLKAPGGSWQDLNAPGADSIAVGPDGILYTAYADGNCLDVQSYDSGSQTWQSLGNKIALSAAPRDISIVVAPNNKTVYTTYRTEGQGGNYLYYVMKFDLQGSKSWEKVGEPFVLPQVYGYEANIGVSNDNVPYFVYEDNNAVSVKNYVDGKWQYVGAANFGKCSMDPGYMYIAFSSDNTPYVTYTGCIPSYTGIHVYRFNKSDWENIQPLSGGEEYLGKNPILATTKSGKVYLGFQDYGNFEPTTAQNATKGSATVLQYAPIIASMVI